MEYIKILVESLKTGDPWIVLGIAAIFGMVGSLFHRVIFPKDEGPKTSCKVYYLLGGALASVGILWVCEPSNVVKLVALSLIAGYGWQAVLKGLENRVTLAVADEKKKKADENGIEATGIGKEVIELFKQQSTPPITSEFNNALVVKLNRFYGRLETLEKSFKK